MLLSVPESGDHVIYPIIPRAFDSTGAQLTVSSSYKIDEEGIHLHWEGDEMESHHTVVLWAIDGHNQEVVCEINVTLQGKNMLLRVCYEKKYFLTAEQGDSDSEVMICFLY